MLCGFLLSGFRLSSTGLKAEAVVSGSEDVTVVGKAIEERRYHLGIAEDALIAEGWARPWTKEYRGD
jgi:hypothetical protein